MRRCAPTLAGCKKVKGLGEDGHGCCHWLLDRPQDIDAALMVGVGGIEQRDYRAGIDQNHRRCFAAITSAIAALASLAGATA